MLNFGNISNCSIRLNLEYFAGRANFKMQSAKIVKIVTINRKPRVPKPFGKRSTSPSPFKCAQCGKEFESRDAVLAHVLTHSTTAPDHHCKQCGKTFQTEAEYDKHNASHLVDKPFHCTICDKRYMYTSTYNAHMLSHQKERKFPCPHCEKSFNQRYNLNLHLKVHTGEKDYMCAECGRRFSCITSLKRHKMAHENDRKFHCIICDKRFIQASNYKRHMDIHTGERRYQCDVCNNKFISLFNLKTHLERGHKKRGRRPFRSEVTSKPSIASTKLNRKGMFSQSKFFNNHSSDVVGDDIMFKCKECGDMFDNKREVRQHIKRHQFHCSTCDKYFESQFQLTRHMEKHGEAPKLKCPICPVSFVLQSSYEKHLATIHKDDHPIKCGMCDFICYKHNHKTHLMQHKGQKVYECELCGKTFVHCSSYTRHLTSHSGERKFECPTCGKKFLQKTHYTKHLKIHTGFREFKCRICGREFHESYYFRKHMKEAHSSETPYLCELCGSAFECEADRNDHLTQFHTKLEMATSDQDNDIEPMSVKDDFDSMSTDSYDLINDNSNNEYSNHEEAESYQNTTQLVVPKNENVHIGDHLVKLPSDESLHDYPNSQLSATPHEQMVEKCYEPHDKEFFCTACCKKFSEQNEYEKHIVVHDANKPEYARALHSTQATVQTVLESNHRIDEDPLPCKYCEMPLSKRNYNAHMKTHLGKFPYHCKLCGKRFVNAEFLAAHKAKKHGGVGEFECEICCRRFGRLCNFTKHMKTHTLREVIQCRLCNVNFHEQFRYESHMIRVHPKDPVYFCDKCKIGFEQAARFEDHLPECRPVDNQMSTEKEEQYDCAYCSEIFYAKDDIIVHLHEVHVEPNKLYTCKYCGRIVMGKTTFEKHQRLHIEHKPFHCDICNRGFIHKKSFKCHMILHRDKKPFQCPKCPRSYCHNYDYKLHLATHDNPKPFGCDICKKRFVHSISLTRHMKGHQGLKPFQCCICMKQFSQSCHLVRHIKVHVNEREFHCTICDRRFIVMYNYKRHMIKAHSSVTPFLCEKCGEGFADESLRDEHMEKHEANGD